VDLPDKQYFKIGEVARLVGVRPSVLRFWETEFRSIRPEKSRTNQRLYSRKHVERIAEIKSLLYEQKFTIAGARRRLRDAGGAGGEGKIDDPVVQDERNRKVLARVRKELQDLLQLADE
jgi:DNA-binding transcriptional MerR regulator